MTFRRIMVLGSPGSGKSTVARALGARLGVPVFHLDRLYHRPAWQPPRDGEFEAAVARVAAQPEWVIDGNYLGTVAARLSAADAVIYLDVPRRIALVRIVRRILLGLGRQRPDAAPGCPERLDFAFLFYVWRWETTKAPRIRKLLETFGRRVVLLRSSAETTRFLETL